MRIILLLFLCCFATLGQAQNLVPDPGFEFTKGCPDGWGQTNRLKKWKAGAGHRASYYHSCSNEKESRVRKNSGGSQEPFEGEGYIGMVMDLHTVSLFNPAYAEKPLNEFVMAELKFPLDSGQVYRVSLYASLGDNFNYATQFIGARFWKERVWDLNKLIGDSTNYLKLRNAEQTWLDDKKEWMEVSGTYIAQGGETYLIIGNGSAKLSVKKVDNKKNLIAAATQGGSYYFIDQVEVIPLSDDSVLPADN